MLPALVRAQWPELLLFWARAGAFLALQVLSGELARSTSSTTAAAAHWPLMHSLAMFSYCWLMIGGTGLLWVVGEGLWRWTRMPARAGGLRAIMRQQLSMHSAMCHAGFVLVVDSSTEEEEEPDDDEEVPPDDAEAEEEAAKRRRKRRQATTAYAATHACGAVLYVLSFGLSGIFWLPQYALLFAALGLLFMRARAMRTRSRATETGLVALGLLLMCVLWREPRSVWELARTAAQNLWLGVLLPVGTLVCVVMLGGRVASLASLSEPPLDDPQRESVDALATLGLPTLVVLSLTFLSLHLPTRECVLWLPDRQIIALANFSQSPIGLGMMMDTANLPAPVAALLNATRAYYAFWSASTDAYAWVGVSPITLPDTSLGLLALCLAPSLLWLSVLIVLRSALRTPQRIGSTIAAYVAGLLAQRVWADPRNPWLWALMVVFKCVLVLLLIPELRALERHQHQRRNNSSNSSKTDTPLYSADWHMASYG